MIKLLTFLGVSMAAFSMALEAQSLNNRPRSLCNTFGGCGVARSLGSISNQLQFSDPPINTLLAQQRDQMDQAKKEQSLRLAQPKVGDKPAARRLSFESGGRLFKRQDGGQEQSTASSEETLELLDGLLQNHIATQKQLELDLEESTGSGR